MAPKERRNARQNLTEPARDPSPVIIVYEAKPTPGSRCTYRGCGASACVHFVWRFRRRGRVRVSERDRCVQHGDEFRARHAHALVQAEAHRVPR